MNEAIRKTIEVAVGAEAAFHAWTVEFGRWWPLDAHAVGEAVDCCIEGRTRGRIYKITRDGAEHHWGTVSAFEPPHRLVHSWHPGCEPGEATTIEVRFADLPGGRCRIDLSHEGWGSGDEARRSGYEEGWNGVLQDGYAVHVEATAGADPRDR